MKSLKLNGKTLRSDLVSGFSTGLFSIPEGMAYAKLAGVNPVYGLYSGMIATVVASLTTGSMLMISTLTSAIALSTASVIQVAGIQPSQMPQALFTITFLVGAVMFVMGLLRLGNVVNFFSNAVMTGFVAGASLLIIIGELGDFSGYDPTGANKLMKVVNWFANIGQWDPTTTAVGLSTVIFMIILKRFERTEKLAPIITLFVMTIVVKLLNLSSVALVGSIAKIPNSLPTPLMPSIELIPKLALGSVSVAMVALIQGAGIGTAYGNPDGSRSSASRDFVGQGLGNLVGSFFSVHGDRWFALTHRHQCRGRGVFTLGRHLCRALAGSDRVAVRQMGRAGTVKCYCRDAFCYWCGVDCGSPAGCPFGLGLLPGVCGRRAGHLCLGAVYPVAVDDISGGRVVDDSVYLRLDHPRKGEATGPQARWEIRRKKCSARIPLQPGDGARFRRQPFLC